VPVPLRDGVLTRADVWRPEGGPRPAVLVRTPYGKEEEVPSAVFDPRMAADRGFAAVVQDVRGRGASGGSFDPYVQEGPDGHDSVRWVAEQPWCDGRVVMAGPSYVGATQWLAAASRPSGLAAVAPALSADDYGDGWTFRNGVLELGFVAAWIAAGLGPIDGLWLDGIERAHADPECLVGLAPWVREWFTQPQDSRYWRERSATAARAVGIPALSIGGWYDIFLAGTLRAHGARHNPADRLIIGPWGHDVRLSHVVGERNLGGPGSGKVVDVAGRTLDFFADVLDGRDPGLPPVLAYVLGGRRWLSLPCWPPPDMTRVSLPLGSGTFVVDPGALPPSLGGRGLVATTPGSGYGPRDQRPIAARPDVLTFFLEPLPGSAVLAGPVTAQLRTSACGGQERDWAVTLCLEAQDGRWDNVCEGVSRCPVDADEVEVPLGDVCVQLEPGQRLVVLVAGGSFPRWAPPSTSGRQTVRTGSALEVGLSDR
jgi:predicted acyl esterase